MDEERFLSLREAARALDISAAQLRRRCYDGTVEYWQIGRRGRLRIPARALLLMGVTKEAIQAASQTTPPTTKHQ